MYPVFLALHNVLRWVVVLLAVVVLVRAYRGWLGKRDWQPADRKFSSFFAISMDVQFLVGIILYVFLSPLTRLMLQGQMSQVMGNDQFRFFGVEHIFFMILGLVFAHLGTLLPRRAEQSLNKHRQAALWFSLAALTLLFGIPWWRPLFPGLG
jgi:hypothetical protein